MSAWRPELAYGGYPVSYESWLLPPERLAALLGQAGLAVTTRMVTQLPADRRPQAYLMARRP